MIRMVDFGKIGTTWPSWGTGTEDTGSSFLQADAAKFAGSEKSGEEPSPFPDATTETSI